MNFGTNSCAFLASLLLWGCATQSQTPLSGQMAAEALTQCGGWAKASPEQSNGLATDLQQIIKGDLSSNLRSKVENAVKARIFAGNAPTDKDSKETYDNYVGCITGKLRALTSGS